jgi:exodeoxyribonuclease VII small subunit
MHNGEQPTESMSYSAALARLQAIVAEIGSSDVDVDKLEGRVKEAVGLIEFCRAKLHGTQSAVEAALLSLDQEPAGGTPPQPQGTQRREIAGVSADEGDPFADD